MGRSLMFQSMDEKLLARSLPAVEGFVLSQTPKYLFGVRAMFGMRIPRSSKWDTLIPRLLYTAHLSGLSSRPIEEQCMVVSKL